MSPPQWLTPALWLERQAPTTGRHVDMLCSTHAAEDLRQVSYCIGKEGLRSEMWLVGLFDISLSKAAVIQVSSKSCSTSTIWGAVHAAHDCYSQRPRVCGISSNRCTYSLCRCSDEQGARASGILCFSRSEAEVRCKQIPSSRRNLELSVKTSTEK